MRIFTVVFFLVIVLAPLATRASSQRTVTGDTQGRTVTGYKKGRPLEVTLVSVGWVDLELRTAKAFDKMRRAAATAGIELVARSGFRSHEQQTWLYEKWRAGRGNRAARPGHSNHQNGRAVDLVIDEPETFAWLTKHARKFGFKKTVRDEPWHWEHSPSQRRTTSAARTATR